MKRCCPQPWFLSLLAGVAGLSEFLFATSFPEMAKYFHTTPHMIEYSVSLFLVGGAIGHLLFGKLSDVFGRRPAIILGILLCILANIFWGTKNFVF